MEPPQLDELIRRYEAGDRAPDLLKALNDAAWDGFHDPWERTGPADPPAEPGADLDLETVLPFTAATIERHLLERKVRFFRDDSNGFVLFFRYDRDCDRIIKVMHAVEGRQDTVYCLRLVGDRRVDPADFTRARELCDRWNGNYRWPRAFLELPRQKDGEEPLPALSGLLVLDFQLLLDKGIHQGLFNDLVNEVISTSWDFWNLAKAEYNL